MDIIDQLRYLRYDMACSVEFMPPAQAQERLRQLLYNLADILLYIFTEGHGCADMQDIEKRFECMNVSLCKVCQDIERLKEEAVFRGVL